MPRVRICQHCGHRNEPAAHNCAGCGRTLRTAVTSIPDAVEAGPADPGTLEPAILPEEVLREAQGGDSDAGLEVPLTSPAGAVHAPPADGRTVEDSADPSIALRPNTPDGAAALGDLPSGHALPDNLTVIRTLRPHARNQTGWYLCSEGSTPVIVSVNTSTDVVDDVWNLLTELDHPHLVKVLRTVEQGSLRYVVQEYCENGSLADRAGTDGIELDWLRVELLPAIDGALAHLHEQRNVAHRDVKPSNIYLDSEDVPKLGDFDLATELDVAGAERYSTREEGTWEYCAPEVVLRQIGVEGLLVSAASDYYSLGVTLVVLLWGRTNLTEALLDPSDSQAVGEFYTTGQRIRIEDQLPNGTQTPADIRLLLEGLLIRDREHRWGHSQVQRWLAGETTQDDLDSIEADRGFDLPEAPEPILYGSIQCRTLTALSAAILDEPEVAVRGLEDGALTRQIEERSPEIARGISEDWQTLGARQETRQLALFAVATRLDPTIALHLPNGSTYRSEEDLRRAFAMASPEERAEFVQDDSLDTIATWLQRRHPRRALLAQVVQTIRTAELEPALREQSLLSAFDESTPYVVSEGIEAGSIQEITRSAYGNDADWVNDLVPARYAQALERWRERHLEAWLRGRGLFAQAAESRRLREQMEDSAGAIPREAAFEAMLHSIDHTLPRPRIVLEPEALEQTVAISPGVPGLVEVPYSCLGPGVPFGVFVLAPDDVGATLREPRLSARSGNLTVQLDVTSRTPRAGVTTVAVELRSPSTLLEDPAAAIVQFRVVLPRGRTAAYAIGGAAAGAFLTGVPRIIVAVLGGNGPVNPMTYDWTEAWAGAFRFEFPNLPFVVGLAAICAAAYGAFRLITWAWSRS